MYHENAETLSISLPAVFVHFINDYIATYENKSPSQVIQDALQLLRDREREKVDRDAIQLEREQQDRELELAYRDAAQEFDDTLEMTALDGLMPNPSVVECE